MVAGPEYNSWRFLKQFTGYWAQQAAHAIIDAHQGIAEAATLEERAAAIDAAYPFGPRELFPYKQWLKVRRAYLEAYGYVSKGKPRVGKPRTDECRADLVYESPLERLYRRSGRAAE